MHDPGGHTPRHRFVLAARADGRPLAAIARDLGVSRTRAEQLERSARRGQEYARSVWGVLPARVAWALRRRGLSSPAEAWALPDDVLLTVPQFGRAALAALRRAQASGGTT